MNFVEAAVLESTDGISFSKEVQVKRTEEDLSVRVDSLGASKSLREQLMENKERKDAEWKERTNPFKPPPGLDQDEVEFLQEKADMQRQKEEALRRQEELDRQLYEQEVLAARLTTVIEAPEPAAPPEPPVSTGPRAQQPAVKPIIPVAVVVRKKGAKEKEKKKEKKRKAAESSADASSSQPSSKRAKPEETPSKAKAETAATAGSTLTLLSSYGEDDDDE